MPREKEGDLERDCFFDNFSNLGKSVILLGYGVGAYKGFEAVNDYFSELYDGAGQHLAYSYSMAHLGVLEAGLIAAFVGGGILLARRLFRD
jgi:hypothetical protein